MQLAQLDSELEMQIVSDARPGREWGECFSYVNLESQNASDFSALLGRSVRRRTAAGTIPLEEREEGGWRLVGKWRTK
jgi:hypothetical protein